MALFDDKQRQQLKKGVQHCNACGQYLAALRTMGTPNEPMEVQNEANQKIIETALRLDEEHSRTKK